MKEIIEQLNADRVQWLTSEFTRCAWAKSEGYFEQCLAAQECAARQRKR